MKQKQQCHAESLLLSSPTVFKNNEVLSKNTSGRKTNKAFTLIELLVAILIIGILSAVALPQYQAAVEKSRATEALINLRHVKQSFDMQYLTDPAGISKVKAQDIVELPEGKWTESYSGGWQDYCTKQFRYRFSYAQFSADRCTPKSDCSNCATDPDYTITIFPSHDLDEGFCSAWTDFGYKVCSGLNMEIDDER